MHKKGDTVDEESAEKVPRTGLAERSLIIIDSAKHLNASESMNPTPQLGAEMEVSAIKLGSKQRSEENLHID